MNLQRDNLQKKQYIRSLIFKQFLLSFHSGQQNLTCKQITFYMPLQTLFYFGCFKYQNN